jgi:hypothetical protein
MKCRYVGGIYAFYDCQHALGKKLWVVRSEFFFMLLGSFIFSVVTPLNLAHLYDFTVSHSLCGVQDSDWPLIVC